jgi:hypothetical protein
VATVGLVVDYQYSHSTANACQLGSWLELNGFGVNMLSVRTVPTLAHGDWDRRVKRNLFSVSAGSLVWFVPPNLPLVTLLGQHRNCILVASTVKVAKVMSTAAPYASAVLCLSEEVRDWFPANGIRCSTVLTRPTPDYHPVTTLDRVSSVKTTRLLVASAGYTAVSRGLRKLVDDHPGLHVTLLTRGPSQARRAVKTARRLTHISNCDLGQIPSILARHDLVLWQRQHEMDRLGLEALWLGKPVVSNAQICGLDTPAALHVNERQLLSTVTQLINDSSRLATMQAATTNGLLQRQQLWHQALRSLF